MEHVCANRGFYQQGTHALRVRKDCCAHKMGPRSWLVLAALLSVAEAQCPSSCKKECGPPTCGPNCCRYWRNRAAGIVRTPRHAPDDPVVDPNVTRATWAQKCSRKPGDVGPTPFTCANLWASRPRKYPNAPPVVLMAMFKEVKPAAIIYFLEYHFLLGVQHAHSGTSGS